LPAAITPVSVFGSSTQIAPPAMVAVFESNVLLLMDRDPLVNPMWSARIAPPREALLPTNVDAVTVTSATSE
jgi:hypothetical protein